MSDFKLLAISPLDGRYFDKVSSLTQYFSEYAFFKYRVQVEIEWFDTLLTIFQQKTSSSPDIKNIYTDFSVADSLKIKEIEKVTNHDVKAVEYFVKEKLASYSDYQPHLEKIHFGCTSEDINNLSYALMIKKALNETLLPTLTYVHNVLNDFAKRYANQPMLARTHGQPASPTTLGKEFANFAYRLKQQIQALKQVKILGKFNGAVGNYNAHHIAYPNINWLSISKEFVEKLGLIFNPFTAQIEPHDFLAEIFHALIRINTILIDLNRDIWGYISLAYFSQKTIASEVGSSTMPHKVNPIDFENSEGNLSLANALLSFLAERLPISRWQRDLVDSTLLRNIGTAIGHGFLGWQSCLKGLAKLEMNQQKIEEDLLHHPEVLAEAVQTVMRAHNIANAYEQLKEFSRGKPLSLELFQQFISKLDLPQEEKQRLLKLNPLDYIGLAVNLVESELYL